MTTEERSKSEDRACADWRPLLDDFADGELDAERRRKVGEHLAGCAGCRREVETLERLLLAARELPESLPPVRELWPEIEARLAPRAPAVRRWSGGERRRRLTGWVPQAVAAALLVAFGAILSQLLWPSNATRIAGVDAGGDEVAAPAAWAPAAELASAEAEYLRVKESLWLTVYHRRELLSPATVEVVEHNLQTIDGAIQEIRRALEEDPGNRRLEGLLFANHRRGIDLLRRLAKVSQEI